MSGAQSRLNLGRRPRGIENASVQQAARRQAEHLEGNLRQAQAPAFEPQVEVASLVRAALEGEEEVDVAGRPRAPGLGASEEIGGSDSEPCRVHRRREAFGETLPPPPVLRSRPQALASELALFPFEVLPEPLRDVVQEL